jgi:hypothetical protein
MSNVALLILDSIIKMSDEAEALGGATSIAGIASLHKMQRSIQKNKARVYQTIKFFEEKKNESQS